MPGVVTVLVAIGLLTVVGGIIYRRQSGRCKSTRRMDGKTVIVTGASAGIGLATAEDLARRGARVIMGCRNAAKSAKVAQEIREKTGNQEVHVRTLDLSDLDSVRAFAREFKKEEKRLDVLINNAGVGIPDKRQSKQGYELTMATNHYGHFLLTNLLLDTLKASAPSRVVSVSSVAHKYCSKVDLDDLNFNKTPYAVFPAYALSKLCNILFTKELARKLKGTDTLKASAPSRVVSVSSVAHKYCSKVDLDDLNFNKTPYAVFPAYALSKLCNILFTKELARKLKGTGVVANSLHPGVVATEVFNKENTWLGALLTVLVGIVGKQRDGGAQTSIFLAVAEEAQNVSGKYFVDCKESECHSSAEDEGLAKKLWEVSERDVKLQPSEMFY
ncbi:retinol dehydrogenase 14-like [Penaeus indicus]|uniref:retinol dehydrogenase 14-like n=1 Tax=Penaeus indicus TaxID=29960 RepID=UPI00300D2BF1